MEEDNPIEKLTAIVRNVAAFVAVTLFLLLPAQSFGAGQDGGDAKIDFSIFQQEIARFEQAINDSISSTFSSSAFAVVQRAKGAYLPGYGMTVSFLINIHRAVIRTPFGDQVRPRREITPEMKRKRIDELKEKLISLIHSNGDSIRQLRKEDIVTIIAFFEDRNFPDEPNANKTIVLSVSKKDLDELGRKSDRFKEFRQRMKIFEY